MHKPCLAQMPYGEFGLTSTDEAATPIDMMRCVLPLDHAGPHRIHLFPLRIDQFGLVGRVEWLDPFGADRERAGSSDGPAP